jgi:CSLREA domain-containing protein
MSQQSPRKHSRQLRHRRQTSLHRKRIAVGAGVSVGAAICFGSTAEAAVDTITVTSLADPGDGDCASNGCTMREAISQADDGDATDIDKIVFQSGLSGAITLNGTQLPLIDEPLYIDGPGAGTLTVDGNDSSRILDIHAPFHEDVKIEGLALTGGLADQGGAIRSLPGGIVFEGADLTIKNSMVSGSHAENGGGVYAFGGKATITNSWIHGNVAQTDGGGALVASIQGSVIENSIISGNEATNGGGIRTSADSGFYSASVSIEESTISDNQATGDGGGVSSVGNAHIQGSTISGNHAQGGGGINMSHSFVSTIQQSTISHNYSEQGAGVLATSDGRSGLGISRSTIAGNNFGGVSAGSDAYVGISSSVVADNSAGPSLDVAGEHFGAGFSLIERPGGGPISASGPNIIGRDPQLAPLADNGGPTLTMMPASTSPAIDQGQATFPGTDQRGQPVFEVPTIANAVGGDGADIGAVELQSFEYVPPPPALQAGPASEFSQKAAIKKCKKKHPKGSKKRKRCVKKAKRRSGYRRHTH